MEQLGIELLKNCRNDLYRMFPYLDAAFSGVDYRASEATAEIGTDGGTFWFSPEFLLRSYADDPAAVRRGYLHMLLHCLYLHFIREESRQERLWDLACDMAAEQIICQEEISAGRTVETAYRKDLPDQREAIRKQCLLEMGGRTLSAETIYRMLEQQEFSIPLEQMERAFHFDDHSFWKTNEDSGELQELKEKWRKLRGGNNGGGVSRQQGIGSGKGDQEEAAEKARKSRYDYRRFLKRFAVPREEIELDTESFDYIYYSYGLEHYKTIPLIEPLEYKEGHKLEELVIAIDTSGSCSGELVGRFLAESYGILEEKENFFQKMKVYFIQCDCFIQDVAVIRSGEEWREYWKNRKIQGRAGTDFRPVFQYIRELREKKELKNLKVLIYFTDGDGIYPVQAPDYQTAFVIPETSPGSMPAGAQQVPSWALRLTMPEEPAGAAVGSAGADRQKKD